MYNRGCFAVVMPLLVFSVQAQAQTAEECMAEVRKVQEFIQGASGFLE